MRAGGRFGGGGDGGFERRLPLLAAAIVLTFGVFFLRLFQLQIVESDALRLRSERNSVRTVRLDAARGDILDRDGRIIATTRPAFRLLVVPNDLRNSDRTFETLGLLVGEDPARLADRVGTPSGRRRFQPVSLAPDLSYDRLARVESHRYALPGVVTDVLPRRDYVEGSRAAHLVGYIGEVRQNQLDRREFADYRPGAVVGQAGVESLLERDLRGRAGGRSQVVDVAGRTVEILDEAEPVPGGTIRLTLDLDLQRAAEEAFAPDPQADSVSGAAAEPPRPKVGAVVALDPRNGDVLVLMSRPAFDPNSFAGGIDRDTWKFLTTNEWTPLQNRAISGQYPPGSTYKPILAAAALHEKKIDPDDPVFCPGTFRLGRRTYRCWKRGGHGWVDLHRALVESCDVWFYRAGLEVGVNRLAFFARGFNLGKRVGFPLRHEQPGLIPTTDWKERRFKEKWLRGETVSASIGQGFNLTTPLQMAVAYGAIANGGALFEPRIVLETRDREGITTRAPEPVIQGKVPVDERHLQRIRKALADVVQGKGGTGWRGRVPGITVAGKTGTAQVVRLEHTEGIDEDELPIRYRDHAWFIAFAPVENAEIVVSVLVEHGGHGGGVAAPIAQRVMAAYFEKKAKREEEQAAPVVATLEADGNAGHRQP